MWEGFIMAFFLGLAGSLHCVGMCGPLALAVPMRGVGGGTTVSMRGGLEVAPVVYHAGRIITYMFGGLLFGLMGRGVYLAGWQQGFSIIMGLMILVMVVVRRLPFLGRMWRAVGPKGPGYFELLQRVLVRLWQAPSLLAVGVLGMLNGLLPCGMVYLAIAGALTRPRVAEAVGFMAFFGLGTLPLLLALHFVGHRMSVPFRLGLRRLLPYVTVLVAILLILRGLDLGIPFISPVLAKLPDHVVECH